MATSPFFTWNELAEICPGRWLQAPAASAPAGITSVCDDSRAVSPGALFVAIPGELADGHRFLRDAVGKGAACLLVSQEMPAEQRGDCPCLLVPDSLRALQQLSAYHRRRFSRLPLLGITGSCGKTSTKEMCYAILNQRWSGAVLKTEGNTNNHFGVPRNLLRLTDSHRAAVIEMGSNHPGEIASLVQLVQPTVSLVCNIGAAHLEAFRDLRGVAREKSAILHGCATDGIAIYPHEAVGADILRAAAGSRRTLTFGESPEADISCQYLGFRQNQFLVRLTWKQSSESRDLLWSLGGRHQALNAAAAAAAGTACGLTPEEIICGLQQTRLPGKRMELLELGGRHWANDAYNSNPSSCRASLDWFAEILPPDASCTVILGDMLELGQESASAHAAILDYACRQLPQARIITVGALFRPHAVSRNILNYANAEEAKAALLQLPLGEWLLLKGSNSIRLFQLLPETGK